MSKSTHQIAVKAVDQTAGAFSSIRGRAVATGAQIKSMLGGALEAAGAYLGLRAVKGGIDELGHLSDVAMKTSTSVDELTQATAAMGALGIQNMGIDRLAKSFDFMAKTTGRSGMAGFYQTIAELGKIEDVATRGKEAMRIFGDSGMELMPLINAADQSVDALQTVVAAMPKIPQAAANAGDDAADAMAFAGNEIKSLWLRVLGKVAEGLENCFGTSLRGSMLSAIAYVEYFVNLVWRKMVNLGSNIGNVFSTMGDSWREVFERMGRYIVDYFKNLGTAIWSTVTTKWGSGYLDRIASVWDEYSSAMQDAADRMFEKVDWGTMTETVTKDLEENLQKALDAAAKFEANYESAAISTNRREASYSNADMALKTPAVRNELMLAGSNAANRAAILGPQLQAETKKQTALLGKIADNTKQTATNTADAGETYKEIN